jgi:hypothetical protein
MRDTYKNLGENPEGEKSTGGFGKDIRQKYQNRSESEGLCGGVDWVYLTQDRVQWQCFVISIMDFRVSKKRGLLD